MAKKEALVRTVTSEAEHTYGGLSVAFYDNPRTYTPKGKEKAVTEDRLYISLDIIGKKDHIKRKAKEGEERRYEVAYNLYLAAKNADGQLDDTTRLIDSFAEKNKDIASKEKEAKTKDAEIEELHRKIAEFEAKNKPAKPE